MTASCPGCCLMWCRWTCAGYTPEQFADLVAAKLAGLAAASPGGPRARPAPGGRAAAGGGERPVRAGGAPAGAARGPAAGAAGAAGVRAARARCGAGPGGAGGGGRAAAGSRCWWAGPRRARPGRAGRRWGCCGSRTEPWRLWHPIDPSRPEAALRELPGIGPRTVVWLNEAQFYLDVADGGLGERVAAGLRELLRDPARAPVLVLATLWPQFWDALTARPAAAPTRTPRRGSCWPAMTSPCPPRSPLRSCSSSARRGMRGWPWPPRRRGTGR